MKVERKKNSVRNIIWGVINNIVMIVFPFIIRTIILKKLGTEFLGISSLFTSIIQVLSIADLGFSSAIVYSMYKPISEEDSETICALLNLYKRIYQVVGGIIFVIGICLVPFLPNLIKGSVPPGINIYILYLIYLTNTILSYLLFAYKSALFQAHQRNDVESKMGTVIQLLMYISQIIVLLLFGNYYVYIILLPIFTTATNIVKSLLADRLYPRYKSVGTLANDIKKQIYNKVSSLFIYKIGGVVSNVVDNLVISVFIGLSGLAIYNNYYYILASLFGFLTVYYNSIRAGVGNSLVTESVEKNYNDFKKLFFMQGWLIGWCSICLVCLYQPFMQLWVGTELMYGMEMVVLMAVYFYSWKIHDIVHTYKEALGMWNRDRFRPLVAALVNLLFNVILIRYIGIFGVVISTIISELLVTLPWAPTVLFQNYFHKSIFEYYFKLFKYTIVTIIVGSVTYYICTFVPFYGIKALIIRMMICILIPNIIFVIVYCKSSEFLGTKYWIVSIFSRWKWISIKKTA